MNSARIDSITFLLDGLPREIWLNHIFPYLVCPWMSVSNSYFAMAVTTAFNSPRVQHMHMINALNAIIALDAKEHLEQALKGPNFQHIKSNEFTLAVGLAAVRNSHRCMPLLLQHSKLEPDQTHVVREAACAGNIEVLLQLLAHPGLGYQTTFMLISVAQAGQLEVIKILLEDPRHSEEGEATFGAILRGAITENQMNVIEYLLSGNFLTYLDDAVEWAIYSDQLDIVERLLQDPRVFLTAEMTQTAVLCDRYSIIELFLNYGMMPSHSYLELAVSGKSRSTLQLLLKDGRADPTEMNYSLIRTAIDKEDVDTLDILLADPRLEESTLPQDLRDIVDQFYNSVK